MDEFYNLLYTTLLANCPKDTGNMVANITIDHYDNYVLITISGPTDNYDYAEVVNYNRQRGNKEIKNYHWVERVIKQVSEVFGGNITYELS